VIPLASQTLLDELQSIKVIVDKWCEKVAEGVPGEDMAPTGMDTGQRVDVWVTELIGELRLTAGKIDNVATVISSLYE
jgi:hypothetical protein